MVTPVLIFWALLGAFAVAAPAGADEGLNKAACTFKGFPLFGDVKIVDSFPDIRVQIVDSFPDLKVQKVDSFPDECGKWKIVTSFPDVKIQYVESFPDLKVQFVSSVPGLQ